VPLVRGADINSIVDNSLKINGVDKVNKVKVDKVILYNVI